VDVHWDCRIAQLETDNARLKEVTKGVDLLVKDHQAELARRDEIITRLKEDAERLAILQLVGTKFVCRFCNAWIDGSKREEPTHAPDCPITLHRALMKELE
jgi:hypothetical protein